MAKGKKGEIGETPEVDEFGNPIIAQDEQTPPQFRNPNSLITLTNKQGKKTPAMTLADHLLPQNLKQLPQKMQDRLTGKIPNKTASQLIEENAFKLS